MKFQNELLLSIGALLFSFWPGPASAQNTLANLHSFAAANGGTNSDGTSPFGGVILAGGQLFGTAYLGGPSGNGSIFRINTNGTGFTDLHDFTVGVANLYLTPNPGLTNTDGAYPATALTLSDNTLYGATWLDGYYAVGTVYSINTDGSSFTDVYNFPGTTMGTFPFSALALFGTTLYGTAVMGGANASGTVFSVSTSGTAPMVIYSFSPSGAPYTNSDGASPDAAVIVSGNTLYGTGYTAGAANSGTIWAINLSDNSFTNLHNFSATTGSANNDGVNPGGALLLVGNTLYGSARSGGTSGSGTIFRMNTDGSAFTNLHSFAAAAGSLTTNVDGVHPLDGFTLVDGILYGTAGSGGINGGGTVFSIGLDGGNFTVLYAFSPMDGSLRTNADGSGPTGNLVVVGNAIYGTTTEGGAGGSGAIYRLTLAPPTPQLSLAESGTNLVLTWPASFSNYTLQATSNLLAGSWTAVLPAPVAVGQQNTVTNGIAGAGRFYRLIQGK